MSILIKGVKIPRGCDECYIREKDTCPLLKVNVGEWGRLVCCPLIEIPDHGDLVDVDLLKAECKEPNVWWETEYQMGYVLAAAQVIIPAERSEE